MRKTLTAATIAGAAIIGLATPAAACHPELDLSSDCETITVVARSWATGDPTQRHNSDVVVTVDGATVGRGSFTATAPSFTVVTRATPGTRTVTVVARAPWGPNGEHGDAGTTATGTLTVAPCATTTTTTVARAVTVPAAPAPARPVLLAPPQVMMRAAEPAPTVLAFTGARTNALAAFGVALVALGVACRRAARRTRTATTHK